MGESALPMSLNQIGIGALIELAKKREQRIDKENRSAILSIYAILIFFYAFNE
jgi:hypothetical protein